MRDLVSRFLPQSVRGQFAAIIFMAVIVIMSAGSVVEEVAGFGGAGPGSDPGVSSGLLRLVVDVVAPAGGQLVLEVGDLGGSFRDSGALLVDGVLRVRNVST